MQWTEGIPDDSWNSSLTSLGGHFLQSNHWAAFQSALGRKVFYAAGNDWQCLAILETAKTGIRLYCPYGPTAKNAKSLTDALNSLKQLASQQKAVFVRMEPIAPLRQKQLHDLGLKTAFKSIQPSLTWTQDLNAAEEEILQQMTPTNRNLFRNYSKKGITLQSSAKPQDVEFFIEMMQQVASRNHIQQHSDHYYQTMANILLPRNAAKIYLAKLDGKPVASALCFDSPTTRYYTHAAADFAARKVHPGTALLVQMMMDAKKQGQKEFDFVGVAPADAPSTHPWAGLTKFKQSFGGTYKEYLGTWEMPVAPLTYRIYRFGYGLKKTLS